MQTFLHGLEPWEVKELFSLHQYASDVYDKIIQDITQDLRTDDPEFDDQGRPPTLDRAFDLNGMRRSNRNLTTGCSSWQTHHSSS